MTYSKTRATKDNTADYSHDPERHPIAVAPDRTDVVTLHNPIPTGTERSQTSTPEVRDRFAAPEYVNPNARLPRIQALRGENGASECGYFITETEMARAGWANVDESELIVYEYNSGGKERGLLIQSPRMLVVPRSPLFAFDRQASRTEERLVVAGQYSKQLYSNREKYGTAQCYEVLLLDANNQPLHEIGLAYIAKGANQASFSFHWQQLVNEVTKCHAIANDIPARAKDARFNSLCVFQFTVKRELAGNNAKSPACKVHSHVAPTQSNWEEFFLGRQDEIANRFLNLLAPTTELTLPQSNTLSLAEASGDAIGHEFAT
ncbi:DUF5895 domain-containing protein [Chamaesiphon minutus]|uniref:DUF5895 domain-containing protein n=1 Tax=Chamaesiphon minutus (strain ATCC 27169 / PCC 6605) TaxID=1173020 RepID=K9ULB0_CHAP6|nr:DUF5895 domain-containing protein [Chamaesiphon minutus]AFY95443.1 hypothetical protein Cha6605_4515 [Chamaesiphon minutus PCC 6605]